MQADVEVGALVTSAWRLRWQAPELTLVLAERAVALATARRDEADRLRAELLVVSAHNRLERGLRIAERALAALRSAQAAGEQETAWRLRVELAQCAKSAGVPLTGFAAVRPVLDAAGVPAALRAEALARASECLARLGRSRELTEAISEADRLLSLDQELEHDSRLLSRALLQASAAGHQRRWGDFATAAAAARDGLALLDDLRDPASDSGYTRGRLSLELVCALMDLDEPGKAAEVAAPLLDQPVRAPAVSYTHSGWSWPPGCTCRSARSTRPPTCCATPRTAPGATSSTRC